MAQGRSAWGSPGAGPGAPASSSNATESAAEIALPTLKPRVATPKTSTEMPVVVVFDLETTGLSKDRNRIIELAAVNATNPSQAPMSTLVNPGRFNIPPPVVALTGITNAMVSAPAVPSFARAAELLEEFVVEARKNSGGASVLLAAHNARQFDAGFLQAEYRRLGRELPDDWRFVDTLPLARKRLDKNAVGSFKLEALAEHFGVGPREGEMAHRAQADARMLGDILQGILGVSLEGTAGAGASGDRTALLEAAELMAAHSFSLGDPSKNRLGRSAESDSGFGGAGGSAGRPAQTPSFGATPIVTVDGGEMDVLGSGALPADELDDLVHEDEDDSILRETSFEQRSSKPQRKPFWVAADPINGFVPETMDFARMTEAADEGAGGDGADAVDPAVAEFHARLRADYAAWAEIPVDALKDHGVTARTTNVLKKADVTTVEQVLRCYPRKYQEFARWREGMQMGTAVLAGGRVASYLKPPPSRKGWGHKTPATLTIDVEDGAGGVAVFEMKIWEYIPVDVERQLTPGAHACVRGVLSGKTSKGAYTLEKPTMAMHVDPRSEVEVVPTYPKKHDVAPDKWPDIQKAAVKALKASIPADPMEVSLGLESTVLPELELMSHVDAMAHSRAGLGGERMRGARAAGVRGAGAASGESAPRAEPRAEQRRGGDQRREHRAVRRTSIGA